MPINITGSRLLLVEGKDELNFFEALLNRVGLLDPRTQIISVEGKDRFKTQLRALTLSTGFDNVNKLAIIRDADRNPGASFDSVASLLRENHFPTPELANTFSHSGEPKVGVFIMPGNNEEGMLEDLCLKSQRDHPVMECVEAFIQCAASKTSELPRVLSKAKAHAFLSVMPVLVTSVGIGAKNGYWNFEHDCMANVVDFLRQFAANEL